jgi:hypothetical protein
MAVSVVAEGERRELVASYEENNATQDREASLGKEWGRGS